MPHDARHRGTSKRRGDPGQARRPDVAVSILRDVALDFDDEWVTNVATSAIIATDRRQKTQVSILFTSDDLLQSLNRDFRKIDKVTDVLSFEAGRPPSDPYLGDIAIAVPRALEQGELHGHGAAREVGYLLVHGVLHLLGYDHEDDADQARMRAVEEVALGSVGLSRVVGPDEGDA